MADVFHRPRTCTQSQRSHRACVRIALWDLALGGLDRLQCIGHDHLVISASTVCVSRDNRANRANPNAVVIEKMAAASLRAVRTHSPETADRFPCFATKHRVWGIAPATQESYHERSDVWSFHLIWSLEI